jgi:antitoxin component YwqK of YwqJK toxin-antitoxin module
MRFILNPNPTKYNPMKKITLLFCIVLLSLQNSALSAKEFASLEIKTEEAPNITLGQTIRIGIVALTDKGKEFKTPGFLTPGILKMVEWTQFKIEVEGGTFSDGAITISSNLSEIKNYQVKIKASSIDNPEIKNELILTLNFRGTTLASFEGTEGREGREGKSGPKGPNAVTSSDAAGNGGMGGSGGQGGNGGPGQNIEVYVKMQNDEILKKEMVYVFVKSNSTNRQALFLVDPDGGKIIVSANGGDGGYGGPGGMGGQGGDDTYRQSSGNGGQGGSGGSGGDGSNGGSITVYMDPSAEKLNPDVLKFTNEGGEAGGSGNGGQGGYKGYYESSAGQNGTEGTQGQAGTKGPEIKIVKQKVDVKMESTAGNPQSSSGNSNPAAAETVSTSGSNSAETPASTKPKNLNGAQVKVVPTNTSGMSDYEKNKENGNGPYKYFTDGKVVREGNYKNGETVGLWTDYDSQGNVTNKYYYNEGGDADSLFHYSGKVVTTASRFNRKGQKNGRQEEFFDNGKLKTLETYKDGDKEGKAAQYNEDGSVYFEGNYKDGNREGLWKEDSSGDLAEGNYKNDERDGTWTIKDRKTKAVIRTEKYVNGELQE